MSSESLQVYLLDIEGTVAPIAFVYEQLFPYAREHFESFLRDSFAVAGSLVEAGRNPFTEGSQIRDVMMIWRENRAETDPGAPRITPDPPELPAANAMGFFMDTASAIPRILAYFNWLMDHDRKSTALKSLQGKIWKSGFESGELQGAIFADVPDALRRWSATARVAIYSSGSVEAQRLVFRHSNFGDLTGLIAAYFDTRTGPKQARASYTAIAAAMKVAPENMLFLSDVVRELDAAREAGCQTRLVVREGNAPVEDTHGHALVESFENL